MSNLLPWVPEAILLKSSSLCIILSKIWTMHTSHVLYIAFFYWISIRPSKLITDWSKVCPEQLFTTKWSKGSLAITKTTAEKYWRGRAFGTNGSNLSIFCVLKKNIFYFFKENKIQGIQESLP